MNSVPVSDSVLIKEIFIQRNTYKGYDFFQPYEVLRDQCLANYLLETPEKMRTIVEK